LRAEALFVAQFRRVACFAFSDQPNKQKRTMRERSETFAEILSARGLPSRARLPWGRAVVPASCAGGKQGKKPAASARTAAGAAGLVVLLLVAAIAVALRAIIWGLR
jgi:hypothetical protein